MLFFPLRNCSQGDCVNPFLAAWTKAQNGRAFRQEKSAGRPLTHGRARVATV